MPADGVFLQASMNEKKRGMARVLRCVKTLEKPFMCLSGMWVRDLAR